MGRRRDISNIAIDIGRDGVAAAKIRRGATTIITNTMLLRRPADVPLDKPEVFGRWLGKALTASGIGCGRAAFVLDRNAVSIRQLELPCARNSIGNVLRMYFVVRPMLRWPDRLQIVATLEHFACRCESS